MLQPQPEDLFQPMWSNTTQQVREYFRYLLSIYVRFSQGLPWHSTSTYMGKSLHFSASKTLWICLMSLFFLSKEGGT